MKTTNYLLLTGCLMAMMSSCSDNDPAEQQLPGDASFVGKDVGNVSAAEWYPGGVLGTTDGESYQDETKPVDDKGLFQNFQNGEGSFERNFNENGASYSGLGPAYVRNACIKCHPNYGHGQRQESYRASTYGNGYLLAIYHPTTNDNNPDGTDSNDGGFIQEVTGMPQTQATSPFLPPIDESGIHITWKKATDRHGNKFADGETYDLEYPEITIDRTAFNTDPVPSDYAVRVESTIGIYGTGLIDAIPEDSLLLQYRREAANPNVTLNPSMWDKAKNNFAEMAYYTNYSGAAWMPGSDSQKRVKRFTYALTRATLQDGPGANAMWNITNVTRSDRHHLYSTNAWALKMSKTQSVIDAIKKQGKSSIYYADGTDAGIANAVKTLLSPNTDQFDNPITGKSIAPEMKDDEYYDFMVWHRGLAVPRARNLNDPAVQRGKELFNSMGCVHCHRPSWKTGPDDYWKDGIVKGFGKELPSYPNQTIWPYSDFVQHRLHMVNDIHGSWCRTTPLWGRGLSKRLTGRSDRLHDCRAKTVVEAIMWHDYSDKSDAKFAADKFYKLPKADRDAVVKFIESI